MEPSLDPEDFDSLRAQAHQMVDDMFDHLILLRKQKVWQQMPKPVLEYFEESSPNESTPIESIYKSFADNVIPYASGNLHPGFCGWVQGGGNPVGMLAEFLTAGLNMNCGGRNHVGIKLELQVTEWCRSWFNFDLTAGGAFVTGVQTDSNNVFSVSLNPTCYRQFHGKFYGNSDCKNQSSLYCSSSNWYPTLPKESHSIHVRRCSRMHQTSNGNEWLRE
jgi:hypothetical protein